MKKSKSIKINFNDETAKKLAYVAKSEGMSVQNLIVFLARQKISYFERAKEKIKDISSVDLSEFENDE
ncbi:MAG: hypothetical protein IJZ93_01150 [Clostridia bacterium]|nr:hypothetical protein [Clostridia bacterium]